MKKRNKAVPAVYLILQKGKEILFNRRINTGYYDGWYTVPSGHVEAGELPLDALAREAKEEIGIEFEKRDAKLVHTMYRTKHDETGDRADYFFVVEKWHGKPENMESDKCDDIRWFTLNNLPENLMHHTALGLEHYKNTVHYSEIPYHKKFLNPNNR
ncbi:MAG TPA: NUDIX domain-containing protein [Candidatus Paceibacterota bacterium]